MSVPQRRKLTSALKALLEEKTGRSVGVGSAPRNTDNLQEELPYIVIYPIAGTLYSGSAFCGPQEDVRFDYQIDSHGKRDDQAEWLADLVRETLIDRDGYGNLVNKLSFTNHSVMDQEVVGPTGKLDNVGQIWTVKETFGFTVTSRT